MVKPRLHDEGALFSKNRGFYLAVSGRYGSALQTRKHLVLIHS